MDALLDPMTGDYTGTRTQSLANPVYIRLKTPLGFYWASPDVGSRLHELEREKDTPRVRLLAIQYAEQALASLLTNKRATSITVTAGTSDQPGWLVLLIDVVDATGNSQHFQHPVRVS